MAVSVKVGELIVPTLQRGNAACDAPASRNAGAFSNEFPRRAWELFWSFIYFELP